jgi:type VI secretion system secreted protein VgrG
MVRDWDYQRSAAPLEATDEDPALDPDLSQHFEFPVGEEAVKAQPGQHAATVRKQRYDAERAMREGSSNLRTMVPGYRFTLHDGDGINQDAKLLATRVELYATELTPQGTILNEEPWGFANLPGPLAAGYDSRFLALPESVPFRPAMRTARPRIHGVQAAVVTAEEYPDGDRPTINGDEQGRVRVRFPWDQRADVGDKTPTSRWIRVSQYWAGAGYGALYMPRVGHEVLVAYMQGDPDQPVIVGRVYNAQHTPPYDAKKEPTKSTVRSQSTEEKKEVDGFNEIRFDDRAKTEEIFIHAQRNLNEVVLASHSTSVGGDQSNFVGHDQSNTVKGHRVHTVEDYETVTVVSDRTTLFQANEHHTVASFRDTTIGANDDLNVGGWHNVKVGGGETFTVKAKRDVFVGDNQTYVIGANMESTAAGHHSFKSMNGYWTLSNDFQVNSTTAGFNQKASYYVHAGSTIVLQAGSAKLSMASGVVTIDNGAGASITLLGAMIMVNAGSAIVATAGGPVSIVAGGKMGLASGGAMALGAGGDIDAKAPNIHLNG